ncbi:hypothetical protein IV203_035674 [Nitzschia inconspicua]|uniref:Uncharacterized protein n=1 Tax=Nitzschia inconspicua TaxID=303405 RepID=A0A9K3LDQ6_9STRA|nr:hypothetical protein IV203_035674 [Nitzschia inconspicua]
MAAAVLTSPSLDEQHALSGKGAEDAVERLRANVNRYTRANDRRMVLRSLKDAESMLQITLSTPILPPDICLSELEEELVEETVVLNNISFKPLSTVERKDVFTHAGMNSGCLVILKGLTERLCDENSALSNENEHRLDGKTLYEKLVARLARTSAAVDIVEHLNALLGSSDLSIKHLASGRNIKVTTTPGIAITKSSSYGSSGYDTSTEDKSIRLNLYESNGDVHMSMDLTLEIGLFRTSDTLMTRPWITLKAFLHERANLTSGENYRAAKIKTPSLY